VTRGDAGIWAKALEILEHELPRPTFKTWLEGTVGVGYAGNTLVVGVANEYVGESLVERMYSKLTSVLRDLGAANVEIAFQVHETVEVS
jgi:chromosomal replication initiation ATPase DnaA